VRVHVEPPTPAIDSPCWVVLEGCHCGDFAVEVSGSSGTGSIQSETFGRLENMGLEWEQTNVDAKDPVLLGRWWQQSLGWVVVDEAPDVFEIRPDPDQLPGLLFVRVPDGKQVKNRLHLDFRPEDQDLEVGRLLTLGAERVDIGQGEQSWVVLADPEGNEVCVLGARSIH